MHPSGVPEAQRLSDVRGLVAWLWQSRHGLWHPAGVHRRFEDSVPVVGSCRPNRPPATVCQPSGFEAARGDLGENWPEWLVARMLLREAKELVESK